MAERDELVRDLVERARHYAGLEGVGLPADAVRVAARAGAQPGATPSPAPGLPAASSSGGLARTPPPPPRGSAGVNEALPRASAIPAKDLDALRQWIGDCQRCKLHAGRKTIVFGQGNPHARLMFVGEAPGADEDTQGLAFVGRAGQLLTDIIEKGLKIPRQDVFIANVIKCRPPENRNPEPDEILSCQPLLEKQIDIVRPRVIVGLGKFASQWLLKTAEPISRIRGRLGEFHGIQVMPTWHPAYLLRTPSAKRDVWADMKVVLELLAAS